MKDAIRVFLVGAARGGDRVVMNGKVIWPGLGNRSGLHDHAWTLIDEKWAKSGNTFDQKLIDAPPGTLFEVRTFVNTNRDRGRWVRTRSYTI